MDEKEELLKKDRERQKKREALREKREQELKRRSGFLRELEYWYF